MAKKQKLADFREPRQKRYRASARRRGHTQPAAPEIPSVPVRSDVVRLRLGPGGRFVVPKKFRLAMGAKEGDALTAEVVDGELRVFTRETAVRKVQAMFAPYKRPGVSEVDEFLKERRKMWGEEEEGE